MRLDPGANWHAGHPELFDPDASADRMPPVVAGVGR